MEAESLAQISSARLLSVSSSGDKKLLASGAARIVVLPPQGSQPSLAALLLNDESYPLVGQLGMRLSERHFLFPTAGGDTISLEVGESESAQSAEDFVGCLALHTDLHTRVPAEGPGGEGEYEEVIFSEEEKITPQLKVGGVEGGGKGETDVEASIEGAVLVSKAACEVPSHTPLVPPPSDRGIWGGLKSFGQKIGNEFSNPDSVFRKNVASTAAAVKNEVMNPESDLRGKYIPTATSAASSAAKSVVSAAKTVANEVGNPESKLRSEFVPTATRAAQAAADAVVSATRTVVHEVGDEQSLFRTAYVAPAAATLSAAASTVAHEVGDKDSKFRTTYVAPVANEISNPQSKLRGEILPAAGHAVAQAGRTVANELSNKDSDLRSKHLPAAAAAVGGAAAAVRHELVSPESDLRVKYVGPVVEELKNPTLAGVTGGVATGLGMVGEGAKSVLLTTGTLAGKGVRYTVKGVGLALGAVIPGRRMVVSQATQARLEQARLMTKTAVLVTSGLVAGAQGMARSLGASVSGSVGSTLGQHFLRVAEGGVGAVAKVWEGLEGAAVSFGREVGAGAVEFVGDRYGEEARAAADKGVACVGDLGSATLLSAMHLAPTTIIAETLGSAITTAVPPPSGGAAAAPASLLPPPMLPAAALEDEQKGGKASHHSPD